MHFILFNKIFEYTLDILIVVNSIIFMKLDKKREFSKYKTLNKKVKNKDYQIILYKIYIIFFYLVVFFFILSKYISTIISLIIIFFSFICFIFSLKIIIKNENIFTLDNSMLFIMSTLLYLVFASSTATQIYIDSFSELNHFAKEFLLIIYINIRIFFFAYLFLTNLCTSLKYLIIFIKIKKISNYIKKNINFNFYKIYMYNFNLYRKFENKLARIIDFIISAIIDLPLLILSLIFILIKLILKKFIIIMNNSSTIIKNLSTKSITYIKIALIFSLIITYIIISFNNFFISENLKDIYNLIATVILIPIFVDNIKSHK